MNSFNIITNSYLNTQTTGYYHQLYTGYGNRDNPSFLNILKNTYNSESKQNLNNAVNSVVEILINDLPQIIALESFDNCLIISVPRSKAYSSYNNTQLMFNKSVSIAAQNIIKARDGNNLIKRNIDTKTTHIKNAVNYINNGHEPYPGITIDTCNINKEYIHNQNIILVDDIYTNGVNIDEDCIQALLINGAKKVIFYSVGYTKFGGK